MTAASRYIFYTVYNGDGDQHCVRPVDYRKDEYDSKYVRLQGNLDDLRSTLCIWDLKVKENSCGDIHFNYENEKIKLVDGKSYFGLINPCSV